MHCQTPYRLISRSRFRTGNGVHWRRSLTNPIGKTGTKPVLYLLSCICCNDVTSRLLSNRSSRTVHNAPPFKILKLKQYPFKIDPELSYSLAIIAKG